MPSASAGWRETHERLSGCDRSELSGDELDLLADALFWLDRPQESTAARRDAYRAHLAAGAVAKATLAAWRVFYDHFLVGEMAVAAGWLERARRHGDECGDPVAIGWVAIAAADCDMARGDAATALPRAQHAVEVGRRAAVSDLTAMALQTAGRALIELGYVAEGVALLDQAMVSVVNGELDPLFTGWVYCNVLVTCHGLADLRRAAEWCDQAMRWCDNLRDGQLYPGLCRIHAAELASWRGLWAAAEVDAHRACDELTAHDPRYAGEAFYLMGEICRLRCDLDAAQEAFTRANGLGRLPQPGLALVRLAQGRPAAAVKSLRSAARASGSPLRHAQLLAALVEAELQAGDTAPARVAADELAALARASDSPFLVAVAAFAAGNVLLAEGDVPGALASLSNACAGFHDLGFPYEAARAHMAIGVAARRDGDDDTAVLELESAVATFDRLGALDHAERARSLVGANRRRSIPLTGREVEVLRLVAEGSTNKEIGAALAVSEHTVARHVSNMFTKLSVTSRAAATAYAYEHGLVGSTRV